MKMKENEEFLTKGKKPVRNIIPSQKKKINEKYWTWRRETKMKRKSLRHVEKRIITKNGKYLRETCTHVF